MLLFGGVYIFLGGAAGDGGEELECDIAFDESGYIDVAPGVAFGEVASPEESVAV